MAAALGRAEVVGAERLAPLLRGPLLVVWDRRDPFSGEDEPPTPFDWPWPAPRAAAVDALGQPQPVQVADGHVRLGVSVTPLFVTTG